MLKTLKRMARSRRALPASLVVAACGSPGLIDAGPHDAGSDAGRDASVMDSGYDAGASDAGHDAGYDAGDPCPNSDAGHNDAGMLCVCELVYNGPGDPTRYECCDPDLGNPCPVCCYNPRDSDGGRQYFPDSGTPVCYC